MKYAMRLAMSVPIVALALVILMVWVAQASAYLHVADARSYAVSHVWFSAPCYQSSYTCWRYPFPTSWYERLSDSSVRVEIALGYRACSATRHSYRVFGVVGSDSSPSINSGTSFPYWRCPA